MAGWWSSQNTHSYQFSSLSYMQGQDKLTFQSGLVMLTQELAFISCPGGGLPCVPVGSELSLQ